MVSKSGSSGKTGKGLGSGWVTSTGLVEGLVWNQLAAECQVVRIAMGEPPMVLGKIVQ